MRPTLGFVPSCPLRSLTGIPCPLCGMTRGVEALVHGDVVGSLRMNPGALLLVLTAVAFVGFVLVPRRARLFTVPAWSVPAWSVRGGSVVATFAGLWGWQLFKFSTGRPL
jgi:hypothetical protein